MNSRLARGLLLVSVCLAASSAVAHDPPNADITEKISKKLEAMSCEADPEDVIEHEGNYEVMLATCADGSFFIKFDAELTVLKKIAQ